LFLVLLSTLTRWQGSFASLGIKTKRARCEEQSET
jgi:hypothetical protein